MTHDIELAYLGIEIPDPASLNPFFADVVGLVPGSEGHPDGTLTWRNDDKAHRVIVSPGAANDATFIGFEATGADAFDRVVALLHSVGAELTAGTPAECTARHVERMAHTFAPWGVRVELIQHLEPAGTPYASPLMPGGFLTEGVGFGHAVFATTAFDESHRFLVDGLGLSQSDWLEAEIMEGIQLEVRFYHCNARHHTVALAKSPFDLPQKLHHIMFETKDRDDVGAAFDRAWESGLPIPSGLGRHDNDKMFSFYVASPAGFQVEIGYGARLITDTWDDNRRYERISTWGHKPLRQP